MIDNVKYKDNSECNLEKKIQNAIYLDYDFQYSLFIYTFVTHYNPDS